MERSFQCSSLSQRGENTVFSQLVILSLVKLVTLCTMSSIVPLIIPRASLLTHLPGLRLMPGSCFSITAATGNTLRKTQPGHHNKMTVHRGGERLINSGADLHKVYPPELFTT